MIITAGALSCSHAASSVDQLYAQAVEAHWKWNLDEAIQLYTRVIDKEPNYARAYFNRGVAYRSKRDFDKALSDFSKTIEIDSTV